MIVYIAIAFFITIFGVIIYFILTRDKTEHALEDREHHHHEHRGYCSIEPKKTDKYNEIFPEEKP
jgi:hypothetical protein